MRVKCRHVLPFSLTPRPRIPEQTLLLSPSLAQPSSDLKLEVQLCILYWRSWPGADAGYCIRQVPGRIGYWWELFWLFRLGSFQSFPGISSLSRPFNLSLPHNLKLETL